MSSRPQFELVDEPLAYRRAADALNAGRGPFALDTERASTFRYDDRAFLVQVHRRGAGTFLIAPEGHRKEVRRIFAPVLGGADWILHAAGEDLPSLAELGLYPGSLFDTELAGRLGGFDRPNLAAMVERFVGVTLEKGHGREDWSTTPLPWQWQEYAALDVLHLNELAEAQAEYLEGRGLLAAASQEFAHLAALPRSTTAARKTWRDVKGVASLRSPAELQVARALWAERDAEGRATDTAPNAILPNKVLVDLARARPLTLAETARTKGFPRRRRGAAERWSAVIRRALDDAPSTWPSPERRSGEVPGKSAWERHHPESWEALSAARAAVAGAADALGVAPEVLLQPAMLRRLVWDATSREAGMSWDTHATAAALARLGARPWQVEATAVAVSGALRRATEEAAG
ncbi:HRDC domain-containing protein [Corynebacterium senegalense]|uniref:HRDC domain-containing protein n=1 Tax=Corynebacterium senegalense TaxID=2080750 RepID=UPI000E20A60C|nr:HRDC domain-containing protein [Corynebacterium senegalense]